MHTLPEASREVSEEPGDLYTENQSGQESNMYRCTEMEEELREVTDFRNQGDLKKAYSTVNMKSKHKQSDSFHLDEAQA